MSRTNILLICLRSDRFASRFQLYRRNLFGTCYDTYTLTLLITAVYHVFCTGTVVHAWRDRLFIEFNQTRERLLSIYSPSKSSMIKSIPIIASLRIQSVFMNCEKQKRFRKIVCICNDNHLLCCLHFFRKRGVRSAESKQNLKK